MAGDGTLPARSEVEARRTGYLVRGGPTKADVWTSSLDSGARVVVKDFSRKTWLVRQWGRVQISREARFLELLDGAGIAPRFAGRLGRYALAMEYVDGTPLYAHPGPGARPHLARLRVLLDDLQARGIVHNDLRGRENILLLAGGEGLVLLDWASAVRLPPGTLRHRALFGALKRVDDSAFLKWKDMLDPSTLTADERAAIQRFRRWRRLWPLNRKGVGWTRTGS